MGYDDDSDEFTGDDEHEDDADYDEELEDSFEDGVLFLYLSCLFCQDLSIII